VLGDVGFVVAKVESLLFEGKGESRYDHRGGTDSLEMGLRLVEATPVVG
jgi:hypothetical protein